MQCCPCRLSLVFMPANDCAGSPDAAVRGMCCVCADLTSASSGRPAAERHRRFGSRPRAARCALSVLRRAVSSC